jgi:hypothetical protein
MAIDWNDEPVDQLEWHWQHQLRPRLDGLTDDEYFWQPVPDCWTISRRGPLEWNVEQTITHMIAAAAKYTLYLASRSERFIGLSISRWPGATNEEVIDSLVPVATGLANVAMAAPPHVRAYHATDPSTAADYIVRGCVELSSCTPATR